MKKLILPLVMLAMAMPSFGQIVRSTTFTKQEVVKEKSRIDWYVRLGLSCNNLTGGAVGVVKDEIKEDQKEDKNIEGYESKAGFKTRVNYDLMFGFNKFFGKTDLYWGMELGLGTRGGAYRGWAKSTTEHGVREGEDKCYVNSYGVKYVPFVIGYKYPVTKQISIDAHLGIWAEFDFAGSYTEDEWYKRYDEPKETYKDSWGFTDDYVNGTRFDAGLQLGIGVWFGRFNLNFTWQRGFAPYLDNFPFGDSIYDKKDNQQFYNSSNAIISLGVAF